MLKFGAGDYPNRMVLKTRTLSKNSANGHDLEIFTDSVSLWCRIELSTGRNPRDYGAEQTGADATIHIRNFMTNIFGTDRLYCVKFNEVWVIDNIRRGDNEMIANCFKYESGIV